LGLSGSFNSSDLKDQINLIQDYRFVTDSLYSNIAHTDIRTNLSKLIDKKGTISATVTSKVAAKDMLNKVDKLLDRSPVLAYNLALAYTISRNDNILKITEENNPLAYLTAYDNRAGAFGIINVNDLRNSFSSLIK
jgi:hypothetical protein